jgi:hypothetical protein
MSTRGSEEGLTQTSSSKRVSPGSNGVSPLCSSWLCNRGAETNYTGEHSRRPEFWPLFTSLDIGREVTRAVSGYARLTMGYASVASYQAHCNLRYGSIIKAQLARIRLLFRVVGIVGQT